MLNELRTFFDHSLHAAPQKLPFLGLSAPQVKPLCTLNSVVTLQAPVQVKAAHFEARGPASQVLQMPPLARLTEHATESPGCTDFSG